MKNLHQISKGFDSLTDMQKSVLWAHRFEWARLLIYISDARIGTLMKKCVQYPNGHAHKAAWVQQHKPEPKLNNFLGIVFE